MRLRTIIIAVLTLVTLCSKQALAERRVALVIGNAAYPTAPLKNPVNDAKDMANALKNLGFEVILRENSGLRQMEEAVDIFWQSLKKGGTGLFFFAGHGLQVKGVNYLVPVDARIQVEQDVKSLCLDANRVLGRMENAGNGLNLVILDACRNNPFARSWRSTDQGLAKMDAPTGTLIAYATAPDSVAADGSGRNGVYTQHLLQQMRRPGVTIENVLKQVRIGVLKETERKQTPWESSSLTGDFYFSPGAAVPSPPVQAIVAPAPKQTQLAMTPQTQKPTPSPGERKVGDSWTDPTSRMEFLWVPPGCFKMGSPASDDGFSNEQPEHTVCLTGFWLGKYTVTVSQFRQFIQATGYKTDAEKVGAANIFNHNGLVEIKGLNWRNPGFLQNDSHPVVAVSWNDAQAYADWLSKQNSEIFRLPTEAEWEYAARSGTTTLRFWGDNPDETCKYANVLDLMGQRENGLEMEAFNCSDGYAQTAVVGSYSPNAFGLHDMLGNVMQWCEDIYQVDAYVHHARNNPVTTVDGVAQRKRKMSRVVRGSSWNAISDDVRAPLRTPAGEDYRYVGIGFRLVRFP